MCTVSCKLYQQIMHRIYCPPPLPFLCSRLICASLPLNHTDCSMMSGCRNLLCNLRVGVCTPAYARPACQRSAQAAVCMRMCVSTHRRGVRVVQLYVFVAHTCFLTVHFLHFNKPSLRLTSTCEVRSSLKKFCLCFHGRRRLAANGPDALARARRQKDNERDPFLRRSDV